MVGFPIGQNLFEAGGKSPVERDGPCPEVLSTQRAGELKKAEEGHLLWV